MAKNIKGRKFVATAASAALVASAIVPVASAAEFSDASKVSEWAKEHVEYATSNGLLNGNADGTFNPQGSFTRAQAAQVIVNVLGLDTTNTTAQFSDVPAGKWYYEEVNAAKAAGVIDGVGDGKFNPEANLSRQDASKLFGSLFNLDPAKADKTVLDQFNDKASIADYADEYVAIFAATGIINGKGEGFDPTGDITREELAKIISLAVQADKAGKFEDYKLVEEVKDVAITSVTAINATTAEVKFAGALPEGADFSNFDINGGLNVTDVKLSTDRKTATVTVNPEFVRNQEYTITVFGFKNAEGEDIADATGKFTWEVAEGVVVALDATTLEAGQTVGVTVKDNAGKDVKDAEVTVTSLNTNLVAVSGTGAPANVKLTASKTLSGTTDILVETTLPDGSKLSNTFKVTVKEAVVTVSNAGYTFIDLATLTNEAPYTNTLAFKSAKAVTSLVQGSGEKDLVAFSETNGNPDTKHLDFTGAKVTSSNAIVATAVVSSDVIKVTPLSPGTATINVTLANGSRKSFPITVTATPVTSDIKVDATTVKLSDENRTEASAASDTTGQDGVDAALVTVNLLDQFGGKIGSLNGGKVTVSSSTDGINLAEGADVTAVGTPLTTSANTLTTFSANGEATFAIQAKAGKTVSNARVTVSYFKNANDARPTSTKTITVNVVDVANDAPTANIDVVAGNEIDANSLTTEINFDGEVYALDSKGNRVENISATATNPAATTATLDPANVDAPKYLGQTGAKISFDTVEEAKTYLRQASTVNVTVAVTETAYGTVTKVVPVTYKNTAVVPAKAAVATSPVVVKLPTAGSISYEEIIFGKLDATQLIEDDVTTIAGTTGYYISPLKTARNAGYLFNKPVVSFTGTDNKAFVTGAGLYGTPVTTVNGNLWTNAPYIASTGNFEVEFSIANVSGDLTLPTPTSLADTITLASGQSTSFTLVITGIYVKGSVAAIEGATPTAEQKAKHNLLAAPAQLNVSVSAQ